MAIPKSFTGIAGFLALCKGARFSEPSRTLAPSAAYEYHQGKMDSIIGYSMRCTNKFYKMGFHEEVQDLKPFTRRES